MSDIVAQYGNVVAKPVNNVKTTFDFVERIVRQLRLAAFDIVASVDGA